MHLFAFIREHQEFYRIYFSSQRASKILDYMLLPFSDDSMQKFLSQSGVTGRLEYEYCQTFFISGLTAVLQKWLNGFCKESEDELLRLLTIQLSFCTHMLSSLQ